MNDKVKTTLKMAGYTTIAFTTYKLTTCVLIPASGLAFLITTPIRIGELFIPKWFPPILMSAPCIDPIMNIIKNKKTSINKNYDIPDMINELKEK